MTPTADNIKVSASRKGNIVKVTTENKNKCAVDYDVFICFYKNGELIVECGEGCRYIGYYSGNYSCKVNVLLSMR